jgi:hypothetical protein
MKNSQKIINYLSQSDSPVSFTELKNNLQLVESTLTRNLEKLQIVWEIKKTSLWKNTFYSLSWEIQIRNYLEKDFFLRPKVSYNPDFLRNYIPNTSSFLGEHYKTIQNTVEGKITLNSYDYTTHMRMIETLLIDLSFASSKLEWNTYSYLDTEVLIKYWENAEGKTTLETQMILNHKNVLKYIIEQKNNIFLNSKVFFEVHTLLAQNILNDSYLWNIRTTPVKIWASTYSPLSSQWELKVEFDLFLKKLQLIKNPFEQSLFILVFIPYFQIFFDVNKRVSRIACNIPLINNWLPPISLLQVPERDYIDAILWVYELNDPSLMAKIYTENYLLNIERYI